MATELLHRRGTQAENDSTVGGQGEIFFTTDTKRWYGHDGATPGGQELGGSNNNMKGQTGVLTQRAAGSSAFDLTLDDNVDIDATKSWRLFVRVEGNGGSAFSAALIYNTDLFGANIGKAIPANSHIQPSVGVAYDKTEINTSAEMLTELSNTNAPFYLTLVCTIRESDGSSILTLGEAVQRPSGFKQNDFATELFTFTTATGDALIVLGGGEYGFYPRVAMGNASPSNAITDVIICKPFQNAGLVLATYCDITTTGTGTRSATVQQRYITASPPYDLGDGEIHGMLYLQIKKSDNSVVSHWASRTPQWIYNGATKATPDGYVNNVPHVWQRPTATLEQIRNLEVPEKVLVPLTHAIKNADMPHIPHPIYTDDPNDEYKVILADPLDECIKCMLDELNAGNEGIIREIVESDGFTIDAEPLSRATPPGVDAHRITF